MEERRSVSALNTPWLFFGLWPITDFSLVHVTMMLMSRKGLGIENIKRLNQVYERKANHQRECIVCSSQRTPTQALSGY